MGDTALGAGKWGSSFQYPLNEGESSWWHPTEISCSRSALKSPAYVTGSWGTSKEALSLSQNWFKSKAPPLLPESEHSTQAVTCWSFAGISVSSFNGQFGPHH